MKDHDEPLGEINFVPFFEDITIDYEEGTTRDVTLHDGSRLFLKKLDRDYDPTDKLHARPGAARDGARAASTRPACSTSSRTSDDFCSLLNLVDEPLATCRSSAPPPRAALDEIMDASDGKG